MKTYIISFILLALLGLGSCEKTNDSSLNTNTGTGTGGSLARFTISGNNLYVVDQTSLRTFDITVDADPRPSTTIPIGQGIETVFPYGNNLFIGASDAMYIYDITNPAQPQQLSRYTHFVGCDPVVVQGNYAYVTLRTTGCRTWVNANILDVIDIRNLRSPTVVNTLTMTSPYGLGVRNNALFVCEGTNGLRVFDVTNPTTPVQKSILTGLDTYDVIPLAQSLLVIGQDGLLQYDYTDLSSLKLLSKIATTK